MIPGTPQNIFRIYRIYLLFFNPQSNLLKFGQLVLNCRARTVAPARVIALFRPEPAVCTAPPNCTLALDHPISNQRPGSRGPIGLSDRPITVSRPILDKRCRSNPSSPPAGAWARRPVFLPHADSAPTPPRSRPPWPPLTPASASPAPPSVGDCAPTLFPLSPRRPCFFHLSITPCRLSSPSSSRCAHHGVVVAVRHLQRLCPILDARAWRRIAAPSPVFSRRSIASACPGPEP